MDILITLIIGCVIGWLAGLIFKGSGNGLIINILVGLAGSWLGKWLLAKVLPSGTVWDIVSAIIGAVIILAVVSIIRGKK